MLILREGTLGNSNLAHAPETYLEETVVLEAQPQRIKALLRGFELGFYEGDRKLRDLAVYMEVGYADNPNEVVVRATTNLRGDEWARTTIRIYYTLIAQYEI